MKMDEHARAWSHEFVSSVLVGAGLAPEQRSSLHWEILSHLHEKAETRVEARGGSYITLADIQAVTTEMGGREGIAAIFLQNRVAASPRAGFGKRAVAFIIDALVAGLIFGLFMAMLGAMFFWFMPWDMFGPFGFFAVVYFYFVALEAKTGQTLGKMAFNLRVAMEDGRPVTVEAAFLRNIAKAFPPLLLVDVILYLAAFSKDDQRASDRIAKTIVIDASKPVWAPQQPPIVTAPPPPTAGFERVGDAPEFQRVDEPPKAP